MQKGGVARTFIDRAVSRLAVQIDDRHREEEKDRAVFQEVQQRGGALFVRHSHASIHLVLSVQPGEDGRVIHLASTVDGHYLWVACLSAGVCCHDITMTLT